MSLGWEEGQLVWGWQNRSEVWGAFRISASATFIPGDHLWTASLGELSHQWGQPRDRRLWTLLQWRKQRRDEQSVDQPKLQTWIFWAGRRHHCRWAEAVFPSGKWGESLPPSLRPWCYPPLLHLRWLSSYPALVPSSQLLTSPGPALQQPKLLHLYLVCFLFWAPRLFPEGIRKPAAAMEGMSICFGSTSGFCMNVRYNILFPFFKLSTCLSVFGIVCPKPKLTHDECLKECQKCIEIHFHYI